MHMYMRKKQSLPPSKEKKITDMKSKVFNMYHNSPEEYSEGIYFYIITWIVPSPPIHPGEDSSSLPMGQANTCSCPAQHSTTSYSCATMRSDGGTHSFLPPCYRGYDIHKERQASVINLDPQEYSQHSGFHFALSNTIQSN